ncbi:MAG: aldolase [Clostridia bacterium]|nr:aldolase [Clostridia bacterium]
MSLKLMYITNNPNVAKIAEDSGVDRIFIDMEYIGKGARQGGMDTVQCHHTLEDIRNIRATISKAELLVRCNPIHSASDEYCSSKDEIDGIVASGADIIMLPFFKTATEVKTFVKLVGGRARTMLLFETPESRDNADEILEVEGIDEVFVGLNDMSLGYGMKFMFQLLADGTVEELCNKFKAKGLPYGFGGLASLTGGLLPGACVLKEHYRLGSGCVILSRSFCNTSIITELDEIEKIFVTGIDGIRSFESECAKLTANQLEENRKEVVLAVGEIVERISNK